jgi:hypothetical protein
MALKQKIKKKEVCMRKVWCLVFALILLVPAMSHAGTATSRWDVTIGGYIKAEFGYADQARGQAYVLPYRDSGTQENFGEKYGNYFATGVQSRFNFLVKGPDAFGMKTSAFLEGDFYGAGQATGTNWNSTGLLRLRHAYLKLTGANVEYTIGQTTQVFGTLAGSGQILLTLAPYLDAALSVGAARMPQINVEYKFAKDFKFLFGLFLNAQTVGQNYATGTVNSFTQATPFLHARVMWQTDKCGQITPADKLTVLVDGFYGKEKKIYDTAGTLFNYGTDPLTKTAAGWNKKNVDSWGLHGNVAVPVIPAKKNDKTGSVGFSAYGYITQNPGFQGWPLFAAAQSSYKRPDGSFAANVVYGWGPQLYIWLTDKLMLDLTYAEVKAKESNWYKSNNAGSPERVTEYLFILSYDVNPAVRFTFDWERSKAEYAGAAAGLKDKGTANVYRFGAFYFF